MQLLYLGLGVITLIAAAVLILSYICYRMTFYVKNSSKISKEEFPLPRGKIYEPYREQMIGWMKEVRAMPCEECSIRSFDGLTLYGKYFEYAPGAIIEIMFHGYRGSAERDLCGGVQRCFSLGHSALIVDQRCSNKSGGNVISFGVNESQDCLQWVRFAVDRFGADCRLILTGISMGASTVMIAAGEELPKNVVGVLADCGFTSAKAIIKKVIKQIGLPPALLYPFVKLGARLYGRFDLEKTSSLEAMRKCTVPVIFFHGENDNFVPCDMSRENFAACTGKKKLVTVPDAGHGLCILLDPNGYRAAMKEFFED